jgi:hypothetical protein
MEDDDIWKGWMTSRGTWGAPPSGDEMIQSDEDSNEKKDEENEMENDKMWEGWMSPRGT